MAKQQKSTNVNDENKLTPQQTLAVQLLVAGKKQVVIAGELDIAQETISRWRSNPAFAVALNAGVKDAYESTIGSLRDANTDAVKVLRDLLDNRQPRIRLSAAKSILGLHLQLDAGTLELPTTAAAIESEERRAALFEWDFG